MGELQAMIDQGPDLVVLVNPNSPTGKGLLRDQIEGLLRTAPSRTRFWIDETYIDYTGQSVERLVERYDNLIVCKSMSKAYALSGARAAYLCASPHQLEELRAFTPPWAVSLPAQLAAVRALEDPAYYSAKIAETHVLRAGLAEDLRKLGWEVIPGTANFLLAHLPESGATAAEVVRGAQAHDLFLRDAGPLGTTLGERAIRVAVKDAATNQRMVQILSRCCHPGPTGTQAGSSIDLDSLHPGAAALTSWASSVIKSA
jgi:histidinol-phosphate/aromatic aminotransferase/cobyric acid decarboxylase-like protein